MPNYFRHSAVLAFVAGAGFFLIGCDKLEDKSSKAEKSIAKLTKEADEKAREAAAAQVQADFLRIRGETAARESAKAAAEAEKGAAKPDELKSRAKDKERDARDFQNQAKVAQQNARKLQSEADTKLGAALNEKLATPIVMAWTEANNGQSYLDQAATLVRQTDSMQIKYRQLVWQLDLMAGKIADNYTAVANIATNDPANPPAVNTKDNNGKDLGAPMAEVTAVQNKFKQDKEALEKKIADTQAVIDAKEAEIKTKSDDKAAADKRNAEFSRKQEDTKGDEQIANLKEALNAREAASNLNIAIESLRALVKEKTNNINALKDQLATLDKSLQVVDNQSKVLQQAWDQLKQQQDQINTETREILGTPTPMPTTAQSTTQATSAPSVLDIEDFALSEEPTVAGKARQMTTMITRMDANRDLALSLLDKAEANFKKAYATAKAGDLEMDKQAKEFGRLGKHQDAERISGLRKLSKPIMYQIRLARVAALRLEVYAGRARMLDTQIRLLKSFQDVDPKMVLPDDLTHHTADESLEVAVEAAKAGVDRYFAMLDASASTTRPSNAVDGAAKEKGSAKTPNLLAEILGDSDADPSNRPDVEQVMRDDGFAIRAFANYQVFAVTGDASKLTQATKIYSEISQETRSKVDAYLPEDLRTGRPLTVTEQDVAAMNKSVTPTTPATKPADAPAQPGGVFEESPEANEARAAASGFAEALMSGNLDQAKTFLSPGFPAEQMEIITAYAPMMQSLIKLREAVATKFGNYKGLDPAPHEVAQFIANNKVAIAGDTATIAPPNESNPFVVKKGDAGWKVESMGAAMIVRDKGTIRAQIKAYDDVLKELEKYSSIEEINKAVKDKAKEAF